MGMQFDPPQPRRTSHAAIGFGGSPERTAKTAGYLAEVAARIREAGVVPALHPHVGTWVVTEAEISAVLDTTDPELLSFGPDVGHIAWGGGDPVQLINDYRDRVVGAHIKDYVFSVAEQCRIEGWDYMRTARAGLWTEPGRGDMNLSEILEALPAGAWIVIEVDAPAAPTPEESVDLCAEWLDSVTF